MLLDKLNKIRADSSKIDQYIRDHTPRLVEHPKPFPPSVPPIINRKGAEICGIEPNLFANYLNIALVSDDLAIQQKLRELIAITKLITDTDIPEIKVSLAQNRQFNDKMADWNDNTQRSKAQYDHQYKNFNLNVLKQKQDLTFYCDDLVDASWQRHTNGEASIWDNFLLEVISEEFQMKNIRAHEIDQFKSLNVVDKINICRWTQDRHEDFIREQYNELLEAALISEDYNGQMAMMEADIFIDHYDADGNPRTDESNYDYLGIMDDYHDQLRCIAEDMALNEIQRRHYTGEDGYDCIYGYRN